MNSVAANAATEPQLDRAETRAFFAKDPLRLRVVSALVLAPLPIAAIWFGWPWLPLLTAAAAAVMAWEWGRLCRGSAFGQALRQGFVLRPPPQRPPADQR